jgi:hypothetical protein
VPGKIDVRYSEVEPPDQQLPDLARPPKRLLGLELYNQGLDLSRQ